MLAAWTSCRRLLPLLVGAALFSGAAVAAPSTVLDTQLPVSVHKDKGKGDGPRYENGELPPVKNTVGWVDPRLNGGRFIDVRPGFFPLAAFCRYSSLTMLIREGL